MHRKEPNNELRERIEHVKNILGRVKCVIVMKLNCRAHPRTRLKLEFRRKRLADATDCEIGGSGRSHGLLSCFQENYPIFLLSKTKEALLYMR